MREYTKSEIKSIFETLDEDPGSLDQPFRVVPENDPEKVEPDYVPSKSAKKLHNSGASFIHWRAGIGSGKTYSCCRHLVNIMCSIPPSKITGERISRILVIRSTADQLRQSSVKTFLEAFPDTIAYEYFPSTLTFKTRFQLDDGTFVNSEVLFRAFELASSLKGLDGLEITALFCNEIRTLPQEIFTRAVSRIRYPGTRHIDRKDMRRFVITDTNSYNKSNWNYNFWYVKNKDNPNFCVIDGPSQLSAEAENLENLPPNYYEDMAGMDENYIASFIRNEFVSSGVGLKCWPSFSVEKNVISKPANRLMPIYLGIDNGRDAAAVLFNDLGNGRIHIIDEWRTFSTALNTSMEMMCEYFSRKYPVDDWLWSPGGHDIGFAAGQQCDDLVGEDFLFAAYRKFELPFSNRATTNDPDMRVRAVNALWAKKDPTGVPLLTIADSCSNTINAIMEYQYKRISSFAEGDATVYSDKPRKDDNSDICDAIQYGILRPQSGGSRLARESVVSPAIAQQRNNELLKTYVPDNSSGILV